MVETSLGIVVHVFKEVTGFYWDFQDPCEVCYPSIEQVKKQESPGYYSVV